MNDTLIVIGIAAVIVLLIIWMLAVGKKQQERHEKVIDSVKSKSKIDHAFSVRDWEPGGGRYCVLFDDTARLLTLIREEKLYQTSYSRIAEVGWSWKVNKNGRQTHYLYFEFNDPKNPLVKIHCKPAFAEHWQAKIRAIMAA